MQWTSLCLKVSLNLQNLRLMKPGEGLDTSMEKSNMVKTHKLYIRSGAENLENLYWISNISPNHSIKIQSDGGFSEPLLKHFLLCTGWSKCL